MSTQRVLGACALTLTLLAGCSNEASVVGGDSGGDVAVLDAASDLGTMDTGTMDTAVDAPIDVSADVPFRCVANADCVGQPGGAACEPATGRCVACTAASDLCPGGQYCVAATSACAAGCRDDLACAGGDGGAPGDGGGGAGAHCEATTHQCVACVTDAHCPASTRCLGNTCVTGCASDANCAAGQTCCGGGCVDPRANTAHCGGCGRACAVANGSSACVAGACAVDRCTAPFADCDLNAANGCEVDTSASRAHCGACGVSCAPANATGACAAGACGVVSCTGAFRDCDLSAANGCEVDTATSTAHCGACGVSCAPANATGACAAGACGVASCASGFADCDLAAANGCEANTQTSTAHCGACGRSCAPANATGACAAGACGVAACAPGFADCDRAAGNGCEVDTTRDLAHCGGCGAACAPRPNATAACTTGACAYTCATGYADCDGDPANGCEVTLGSDPAHCGSCTTRCAVTNGSAACTDGACAIAACTPGFVNCDGMVGNGCEADLASLATCGSCTNRCVAPANASANCLGGACGFACGADYGNCDNNAANGCERNLANGDASNCGRCGGECGLARAVSTCVARVCQVESCEAGFGNCDGLPANGCEANLRTSNTHCGACGTACGAGTYCQSSACRLPVSCNALHVLNPTASTGEYDIDPDGVGPLAAQRVYCDMTSQGGGWTLAGSVVNGVSRAWNALGVFTDRAAFGAITTRTSANYKSFAWTDVPATDLRIETAEYSFGWTALLGNRSMGAYVAANWPATCNSTWARSGVDFFTGISAAQAAAFGFSLRALDSNATCFPSTNENAAMVFYAAECCWVNGLGNTPGGQAQWLSHDLSLLRLSRITPVACTAGAYPCNANARTIAAAGECYDYDPSCKASYALIWVR